MAYGLLRSSKVKHSLEDAQNARRERLQMRIDLDDQQYIELKDKALEACDYQTSLRALNQFVMHLKIFKHYHAAPLLEAIEKNPDDLEELVDQFLWINTSLENWTYSCGYFAQGVTVSKIATFISKNGLNQSLFHLLFCRTNISKIRPWLYSITYGGGVSPCTPCWHSTKRYS